MNPLHGLTVATGNEMIDQNSKKLMRVRCGCWIAATAVAALGFVESGTAQTINQSFAFNDTTAALPDGGIITPAVEPTHWQTNADAPAENTSPQKDDEKETAEQQKKAREELKKKVASAHKPVFYENDFSYLCDPNYCGWQLGNRLKKLCVPPGGACLDIGGEYRVRAHFERNMRGLGLTGVDDDFLLHRTRVYGDLRVSPDIRLFAEFIDAESNYENFPSRPIEVNRADMLNLFVDGRLLANSSGELAARVGRQELLYGAQRLVSPLDWANSRRTFDGIKLMWSRGDWKVDGFWTHPVFPDARRFDSPDRDQEFMGIWSTYSGRQDATTDLYWLRYLNGSGTNNFKYDTLGARRTGQHCGLLWEVQGAVQFGRNTDGSDHSAGMVTLGIGKKLERSPWTPTAWLYYDWASGDNDLGAGNGFHHLFPLAHPYFGFMDLFGRRNIEDINLRVTAEPSERLKLLVWYHYMFLATQSDSPYSVVMTPFNGGNLPGSPDLGHEIDLIADLTLGPRSKLLLGYSHFFSGAYYDTTAGIPFNGDADFFYTQWHINF